MAYILMADRRPKAMTMAAGYLAKEGHRVTVLDNGQDAIDRLRQELPDVLVLAVLMPRKDGFIVLDELRLLDPDHSVGVILLVSIGSLGEPSRWWENLYIDSYLLDSANHWSIILAVEQLLFRSVLPRVGLNSNRD